VRDINGELGPLLGGRERQQEQACRSESRAQLVDRPKNRRRPLRLAVGEQQRRRDPDGDVDQHTDDQFQDGKQLPDLCFSLLPVRDPVVGFLGQGGGYLGQLPNGLPRRVARRGVP